MYPCPSCGKAQLNAEFYMGDEYITTGVEQYENIETAQGVTWWICTNENCDRFWRKAKKSS